MCFALNPGYIGVFVSKRAVFRKHLCRYSKGKFPSQLSIVSRAKQASMPRRTLEGGSGITLTDGGRWKVILNNAAAAMTLEGDGNLPSKLMRAPVETSPASMLHPALTTQEGAPGLQPTGPFVRAELEYSKGVVGQMYIVVALSPMGGYGGYAFRIATLVNGLFLDGY